MKIRTSLVAGTLVLGLTLSMLGCSSGGSGSATNEVPISYTSVSGTTGLSSSVSTLGTLFSASATVAEVIDGSANLIVDSNANGVFDADDIRYSAPVVNGSFSFSEVVVSATVKTKAQLSVAKEGFAPYVKTLWLTKDNALTVLAEIGKKPIFTEVIDLSALSPAQRASSFVKFGVTSTSSGISSFSKLMSLSDLKAEVELNATEGGVLSTSLIPTGAFPSDTTSVTASLQAFDSTNPEDFNYFPGSLSGHGKPTLGTTATTDTTEKSLESAGFDMIKLTDQNGEQIDLAPVSASKLSAMGIRDVCTAMQWTRYITTAQADVIKAWGDDDYNSANGFQVPIWSNDNATGSWRYIGLADAYDLNGSDPYFKMCVDSTWEGYLNCDSEISLVAPKQVCISAVDQNGNPIGDVSVNARMGISGNYAYTYLASSGETIGKGTLGLTTGEPKDWSFSYSGALTGWSNVFIDGNSSVASTTAGCDYDLNITIDNPFSAEVHVRAYAMADTAKANPLANARVGLSASDYTNYYSKTAYTNANGEAVFAVKPNVAYVASYNAGTANVNVNSAVVAPETADSGTYATVAVQDANMAPDVYIYTNQSQLTQKVASLGFTLSASDKNSDKMTLTSLKRNGVTLVKDTDYTITSTYSYEGYLYIQGVLDVNGSAVGTYTLTAEVTDGKLSTVKSTTFEIAANHAPVISSIYLINATTGQYYYESSAIPAGDYSVSAYAYDIDGDTITKITTIDGNVVNGVTALAQGDHNITVTASDDSMATATRSIKVFVGNHPPVINSSGATKYLIDINTDETFKLFAYVTDAEYNPVTVTATDANATVYTLTRLNSYDTKYSSEAIKLTAVKAANTYTIVANDGFSNSKAATVTVESIASNQVPIFDVALTNVTVNVNTAHTFTCEAHDPEGTAISYEWKLGGIIQAATGTTFTHTFTATGTYSLVCKATDADGKLNTSSATVLVINPTVAGTLSVHTGYQGLIVSRHDLSTYALLEEKVTDSSGNASFAVTGDRTTFAISAWPGMEINAALLMEMLKPELEYQAQSACYSNTTVTECATADWCAMSQTDTIADWVWDITRAVDDTRPLAALVDTDKNGYISATELYNGAVLVLGDKLAPLTWSEINAQTKLVYMDIFANVPVREYYIGFSPMSNNEYEYEYVQTEMCMNSFDVNVTVTGLTPNTSHELQASGSAYGSLYNISSDANGSITLPVYVYYPGADGKYTILLKGKESTETAWNYNILKSKTQAELEAGITLSKNIFAPTDTDVTITNSATDRIESILAWSNGLSVSAGEIPYLDYNASGVAQFFTDASFSYSLVGNKYYTVDDTTIVKNHYKYYTMDILGSTYSAVDYPQLAVDVTFDKNGNWQLSGADMPALNIVGFEYRKYAYDSNTSTSMNLSINMNWTVAPNTMPDINITAIAPSALVSDITAIEAGIGQSSVTLSAVDFKGINDETSLLDAFAGANAQDYYDIGMRQVSFYRYYYDGITPSSSALTTTKVPERAPIFSIGYDTNNLFAK